MVTAKTIWIGLRRTAPWELAAAIRTLKIRSQPAIVNVAHQVRRVDCVSRDPNNNQTGCVFLIEYKIAIMCILSVRGKLLLTNTYTTQLVPI